MATLPSYLWRAEPGVGRFVALSNDPSYPVFRAPTGSTRTVTKEEAEYKLARVLLDIIPDLTVSAVALGDQDVFDISSSETLVTYDELNGVDHTFRNKTLQYGYPDIPYSGVVYEPPISWRYALEPIFDWDSSNGLIIGSGTPTEASSTLDRTSGGWPGKAFDGSGSAVVGSATTAFVGSPIYHLSYHKVADSVVGGLLSEAGQGVANYNYIGMNSGLWRGYQGTLQNFSGSADGFNTWHPGVFRLGGTANYWTHCAFDETSFYGMFSGSPGTNSMGTTTLRLLHNTAGSLARLAIARQPGNWMRYVRWLYEGNLIALEAGALVGYCTYAQTQPVGNFTVGYSFRCDEDKTIDALRFRQPGVGSTAHQVSVWHQGTGALVASTLVDPTGLPAFTQASASASGSLSAGETYVIGAYTSLSRNVAQNPLSWDTPDDIEVIDATLFAGGNAMPVASSTTVYTSVCDILFA